MRQEYELFNGKKYPILWRKKGNKLTDKCPFCCRKHTHGKGEGHRVGHCKDTINSNFIAINTISAFIASDSSYFPPKIGYVLREYL